MSQDDLIEQLRARATDPGRRVEPAMVAKADQVQAAMTTPVPSPLAAPAGGDLGFSEEELRDR